MSVDSRDASEEQLMLFPSVRKSDTFIKRCRPSVASGVTLHALHASANNGMAPLTLPELLDEDIPARNRALMVENLPEGVLRWSGSCLLKDLRQVLVDGKRETVWRAVADVLAREGNSEWMDHLGQLIERSPKLRREANHTFWNSMVWNTFQVVHKDRGRRNRVRTSIENLLNSYSSTAAEPGLQEMMYAARE